MRYFICFVSAFAIGVLAFLTSYLDFLRTDWAEINDLRRLPNIRLIPDNLRSDVVRTVLSEYRPTKKSKVLIIGDSQPYGNLEPPEKTFPYLINKRCANLDVVNFSIVDGRFDDQARLLLVFENDVFDLIVTNINPSHFSKQGTDLPRYFVDDRSAQLSKLATVSDKVFYFQNWFGLDIWGKNMVAPAGFVMPEAVSAEYYKDLKFDRMESHFKKMLTEIERKSKESIIYLSPIMTAPYKDQGVAKSWNTAQFVKSALSRCKSLVRTSVCSDLTNAIPEKGFFDVVHFNEMGHQMFSEILIREIEKNTSLRCNAARKGEEINFTRGGP